MQPTHPGSHKTVGEEGVGVGDWSEQSSKGNVCMVPWDKNGETGPKEVLLQVMIDAQAGLVTSSGHFQLCTHGGTKV